MKSTSLGQQLLLLCSFYHAVCLHQGSNPWPLALLHWINRQPFTLPSVSALFALKATPGSPGAQALWEWSKTSGFWYLPLNPNLDNLNSWMFRSPMEITLLSLMCWSGCLIWTIFTWCYFLNQAGGTCNSNRLMNVKLPHNSNKLQKVYCLQNAKRLGQFKGIRWKWNSARSIAREIQPRFQHCRPAEPGVCSVESTPDNQKLHPQGAGLHPLALNVALLKLSGR